MRRPSLLVLLLGLAALAAPGEPVAAKASKTAEAVAGKETGLASWYGRRHAGLRTASGELYDRQDMTAAHRTLAFGTRVRVTNLANRRSVEVRINDRGPHRRSRIIDVSDAAARALGMFRRGTARVRIEVLAER